MILGSEGNDLNLRGTANGERICGLGGDDRIYGAKGNDFLQGNTGNDIVNGEVGDDFLRGGQNKDELNGGDGNDTLYGDLGDDTLNGNIGNDYVAGGEGNDTVRGGQNDDTVLGDAGNDTIYGDNGNDKLWGGAGTDTFIYMAGNGNDEIHDFEWSGDSLQLDGVTIQSYTQLGLDCRVNLSTGATILIKVGACPTATKTVTYSPTTELFANPERGFYRYFESRSSSNPPDLWTVADLQDTDAVDWLEAPEEATITQIYCLFYLDTFLDREISKTFLDHIRANLTTIRNTGRKCILRFAYIWDNDDDDATDDGNTDANGDGIRDILQDDNWDTEPDLDQLLAHIDQLKPILQDYSDVIAVMQAGFIGISGEWYYTDHFVADPTDPDTISAVQHERRKQVVMRLWETLPVTRTIALRTPQLKKMMFGRTTPITRPEAFKNTPIARIGFHNDAFLNSYGDSGTFESDADRTYLQAESLYLGMGGEVNEPDPPGVPSRSCANAVSEMRKYHWSYINTDYYIPTLQDWRNGGCIHNASNIAGSILDRLGYRFVLKRGIYPTMAKPGGKLAVRIELTNEGFAAPYNKRSVYLVLRNTSTNINSYSALLPDDPRLWLTGQTHVISRTVTLPTTLPVGNYALYLHLADPATTLRNLPAYAIRLANANLWPATNWNGMNNLRHTVTVSNTAVNARNASQDKGDAEVEETLVEWEETDILWTEEDSIEPDSPEESAADEGGAVAETPTAAHNLFLPIVAQK